MPASSVAGQGGPGRAGAAGTRPGAAKPSLPVSDEIKTRYLEKSATVQLTVRRGFDPVAAYTYFRVPGDMDSQKFRVLCAKEFQIPELECVLLNSAGDQITPCESVGQMAARWGSEIWVAQMKYIVPTVRAYDME